MGLYNVSSIKESLDDFKNASINGFANSVTLVSTDDFVPFS